MTSGEDMIVSVGIDVGTKGAISAISGDYDIMYVSSWDLSKFTGVVRLRELQKILYDEIVAIQALMEDTDALIVSIEEPPRVKNTNAYGVLSQMLGVAQLAAYNLTSTVPLTFNPSSWKTKIGASTSIPKVLMGKAMRSERELHVKSSVQAAVLRLLCTQNKNNLRKVVTSTAVWRLRTDGPPLDSDAYDALGVASAGLLELEKVSLDA